VNSLDADESAKESGDLADSQMRVDRVGMGNHPI